eukprot:69536-Alexandrium_andersonii.AAC.1
MRWPPDGTHARSGSNTSTYELAQPTQAGEGRRDFARARAHSQASVQNSARVSAGERMGRSAHPR